MRDQRKISKDKGNDTHVRSVENNKFNPSITKTYEIMTGEVFLNLPEPMFRQNAVSVKLSQNGKISPVGVPGAFIDPITGNLHGSYDGPIQGQMVSIGFLRGNSSAPIILNKYPYQGVGNTLIEGNFLTPMFLAGYDCTDVLMGHFIGSKIGIYTGINPIGGRIPGEIGIESFSACNVTAQTDILLDALVSVEIKAALNVKISAPQVKIDGSATVEINGNTKNFVTHLELDTALQLYVTAINAFFATKLNGAGAAGTAVLNISASKTTKTLCGG